MADDTSAVMVAVRCRPMNKTELAQGGSSTIAMDGANTTITDPAGKVRPLSFTFDYSFWSSDPNDAHFATQSQVFEALGTRLLDCTFKGYNGCLFAYGQTGSGKTYSMMGYGEDIGVIPRLCEALFQRGADKKARSGGHWEMHVEVSYLEIYNEKCRCLLTPKTAANTEFKVREHPVTGPYVENLAKVVVHSFEEIDKLMVSGNKTRTVAATNMNATSSRSHAIFTLTVTQVTTHPDQNNATSEMAARINLVDLAGSERADRTGATGAVLKEGSNINKSLTTLGKVINGLAEGGASKKHVPFRDSALTWLLKENLCGNSKTIMLAALSPAASNYEETVSTLRYADRAKCLRTVAVVNEDPSSKKIRELTEEIDRLKALLQQNSMNSEMSPRGKVSNHEDLSLQLLESEKLREMEAKTWKEKEEQAAEIAKLRDELGKQSGMSNRMSRDVPSLVNLNEDPIMSECLFYTLHPGVTSIGSAVKDRNRDICIEGDKILETHAFIHVAPPVDGQQAFSVTLTPSEKADVFVNGSEVTEAKELHHNDRVIFGNHVYRYVDPKDQTTAKQRSAPFDFEKAIEERFAAEMAKKATSAPFEVPAAGGDGFVVMKADVQAQQVTKLRDMEERIKTMENEAKTNLSAKYVAQTTVASSKTNYVGSPVGSPDRPTNPQFSSLVNAAKLSNTTVARLPNQQIFKQKIVLVGHQEVGKTSLRKCFEGDPIFGFMAKLPDVRSTTGIDTQIRTLSIEGETVELNIADFAGQEAYHSHTLFLTNRSVFALIWKISAVEQDVMSSGISQHEEERLCHWIQEIYCKFPKSKLVLIGTHLDEMRDQSQRSVGYILSKVENLLSKYAAKIARTDENGIPMVLPFMGSFAVSCKSRVFMSTGKHKDLSGKKIGELLNLLGKIAHNECMIDPTFPCGAVPGRHIKLMREVEALKAKQGGQMLISMGEYVHLAVRTGIENDAELLQISQLLHCWNSIYLFNHQNLNCPENLFVFLHPVWLCKLAGTLFSFSHVIHTPLHLRSLIGGLEYQISQAEIADMSMMCRGYLRFPLARILFHSSLVNILKREPEDANYLMCIQLLSAMELLYQVTVLCDDKDVADEEGLTTNAPQGYIHRYFVPSLSPFKVPIALREAAPLLFHKGLHISYAFNMIPKELWYKILHRISPFIEYISVPCPIEVEDEMSAFRLDQADEVHNRWIDGAWLRSDACRLLMLKDGDHIRLYSAETDNDQAEEQLHKRIEEIFSSLLKDYPGIQRNVMVQCPTPFCTAWHKVKDVFSVDKVKCDTCGEEYPSSAVVSSGASSLGVKQYSAEAKRGVQNMLRGSLDPFHVKVLAEFLEIAVDDEVPANISLSQDPAKVHVLRSLDSVVRHLMLQEFWNLNANR